ncbi:MAG: CoB--CoM heterodisulfide reductase iron-sulfur subunit A family protein [Candidatus Latescibacterota bacterium]
MHKKVAVIGGGIAGIQASLDLAQMGVEVYLIEKGPSIGGRMAQLDKTFPTNDCAMCILSPKLVEAGAHPNIKIMTCAQVESVSGNAPDFTLSVSKRARFVDEEKCTGCGTCSSKCPVEIPDEYNMRLGKAKNIQVPFPQAVPAVAMIARETCLYLTRGVCQLCKKVCTADAVDFEQQDEVVQLEVGSIILAAGSGEFDARRKGEYGYRAYPNVLSSIEFERILSSSGPTQGHVKRPSDEKEPKRIAFVQCVGSRDLGCGNEHCSSICCMQAAKDAVVASEHLKDPEATVFYMDIRAYGKDFDKFIERAKGDYGVRFVKSRVSSIEIVGPTDNLSIRYLDEHENPRDEEFDMVVLSVGLETSTKQSSLMELMGLEVNEERFCKTGTFAPISTSRPGVFVCGTLSGPKDIPETVVQASGAASAASGVLRDLPRAEINIEYPPERDIRGEPPRIGVFVCRCGINIGAIVDVPSVAQYSQGIPFVSFSTELLYACSSDSQKLIAEKIAEHGLNRVVVASCTPRTHEPLFQNTLREAGLNPFLFEMANIREHCSWVHMQEPESATEKARDLVRMAVRKAQGLSPLSRMSLPVNKKGLAIGGGVSGLTAALDLAESGFEVHLIEREDTLGGNVRKSYYTLGGEDPQDFLKSLIEKVQASPKINVYTGATIERIEGYLGNFKTHLLTDQASQPTQQELDHGVIIIATGAKERETNQYLYGQDERVITQHQLEERVACGQFPVGAQAGGTDNATVVMIQCVDSRDEERPYCSRICCSQAIKNALRIKEAAPETNVFILYRDIRTYGTKERYYRKAREKGIVFIHFEDGEAPEVQKIDGKLEVRVLDHIIGKELLLSPDLLVLSVGLVASADNKNLAQMLKVPLNDDNFFLEAHVKLRPVDFATEGIFVCGLAHYPKFIDESIGQARAAAGRAITILSKEEIEAEGKVAQVTSTRCFGCGLCVAVCPYQAIEVIEPDRIASVNEALCKGCGTCSASCRTGAIDLKGFQNDQILAVLEAV